jgi:serine/threonine-protein kinase
VFDVLLRRDKGVLEVVFTSDGTGLAFREGAPETGDADIMLTAVGTDAEPTALVASSFGEAGVVLSPDNRWMAYESNVSGRVEVFVRPFPDADLSRVPVSTNGGGSPVWAHNGRELFYVDGEAWLTTAAYETTPTFTITGRERLFEVGPYYREAAGWRAFDVSLDDESFLMISVSGSGGSGVPTRMFYVQNYFEELKERVAR